MNPRTQKLSPASSIRPWLCAAVLIVSPAVVAQSVETTPRNQNSPAGGEAVVAPDTTTLRYVRPLRTFQGVPVRVNTGNNRSDDLSIGIVRPLRDYGTGSVGLDSRNRSSWNNRFDRSDRWTVREVARGRILLDAYPDYRRDTSVGIVRAYRDAVPTPYQVPFTVTNENAPDATSRNDAGSPDANPQTVGPVFSEASDSGDATIYAVRKVQPLDEAQRNDPWALLNQGYYREAREVFAGQEEQTAGNQVTQDTGRAIAAVLSGDLTTARELMPAQPALPEGFAFTASTARRIQQTADYVLADDPKLQDALKALVNRKPAQPTTLQ